MSLRILVSCLALFIFVLAACTPDDEGPIDAPVEEVFENSDSVFATAMERSGLLATIRVENYPLTVFFIDKDAFANYLTENGLTEESFLASDRLEDFMSTFLVRGTNLALAPAGTYALVSGDSLETSNVSGGGIAGSATLTVNDQDIECQVRTPEEKDGAICFLNEPLVDFSW